MATGPIEALTASLNFGNDIAGQWIDARTALEIFGNSLAIRKRSCAGVIRTRARLFIRGNTRLHYVGLPLEFWWADGDEVFEEDWSLGDFTKRLRSGDESRAFGVCFGLEGLMALVPIETHPSIRLRLSVAGNAIWVTASDAICFAIQQAEHEPAAAQIAVIEQCSQGFVSARAVRMRFEHSEPDGWESEEREWDIPPWFWDGMKSNDGSAQNWTTGKFAAQVWAEQGFGSVILEGVHFLRSSLDALFPNLATSQSRSDANELPKPPLSEGELQRWWDGLSDIRLLPTDEIWALASAHFKHHSVSRDRVRAIVPRRPPGPRPITPESSA